MPYVINYGGVKGTNGGGDEGGGVGDKDGGGGGGDARALKYVGTKLGVPPPLFILDWIRALADSPMSICPYAGLVEVPP
jgi:hypothetical protein